MNGHANGNREDNVCRAVQILSRASVAERERKRDRERVAGRGGEEGRGEADSLIGKNVIRRELSRARRERGGEISKRRT